MPIEELIRSYGYPALFVGTLMEGESVLIAAGFAAHRGYLSLPWVIACAFLGTLISDQTFFWLGHRRGQRLLVRFPRWKSKADKVLVLLHQHQLPVLLGFRFLFGIRNVTPLVVGSTGFDPKRFLFLNIVGAAAWSTLVGIGGFAFGDVLERILSDLQRHEGFVLVCILAIGAVAWILFRIRNRKPTRSPT